jgi:hypothetical protein
MSTSTDNIVPELDEGGLWGAAVTTTTDLLQIFSFPEFFNSAAANLARLLDADGVALIVYDGPDRLRVCQELTTPSISFPGRIV